MIIQKQEKKKKEKMCIYLLQVTQWVNSFLVYSKHNTLSDEAVKENQLKDRSRPNFQNSMFP